VWTDQKPSDILTAKSFDNAVTTVLGNIRPAGQYPRRLHVEVSDAELAARKAAWTPPKRPFERGFGAMHQLHVTQANKGCDFDFLEEKLATVPEADRNEPEIH